MCINVDEEDDENTVHLNKKDCSDDHDAEIALVSTYGDVEGKINPLEINQGATEANEAAAVYRQLAGEPYSAPDDDSEWGLASEDNYDPRDDHQFICSVGPAKGQAEPNNGLEGRAKGPSEQ